MSQNIALWGNNYSSVPGIVLPKQGGGTALFTDVSDTTASASDVASGKYFYAADGTRTLGTSSGGGGSSNFVTGSFTTGASIDTVGSFSIPYNGTGYPILLHIFVDGGTYNNGTGGNTTWYNSTVRYAIGEISITKAQMTTAPTYSTSGAANYGVVMLIYKNSASTATTYSRTSAMNANSYTSSNANNTSTTTVRFKGNGTTVSYYCGHYTSSQDYKYGLLVSTKYSYVAVYSS